MRRAAKEWPTSSPDESQKPGASRAVLAFLRNDDYWGPKALPARTEFTFFADMEPQVLALQGHQVDIISQLPVIQGIALLNDPNVTHPQHQVERPYPGAYAQRHGALHRQARAPRHRALRRPQEADQGPVPRPLRHRQRFALCAGLPLDRQDGGPAHAATSPRPSNFWPTPASPMASRSSSPPRNIWRSRNTPR